MPQKAPLEPESPRPNAPVWLKVLVGLHVLAITVWALPNPSDSVREGKREPIGTEHLLVWNAQHLKRFQPVQAYLFSTGFWQYWDMFSPNPSSLDIWCDADVVYRDGKVERYQYPRVKILSIPEKFVSERFRKFYERVNQEDYAYFWPQFAQRIAYLNDDPANPPVAVKLRRHWRFVAPPGKPQPKDYAEYVFYVHVVDQGRLERDRKGRG